MERLGERFGRLLSSPAFRYPLRRADELAQELDQLGSALLSAARRRLESSENDLRGALEKLHLLSPLAVLGRGYSIAFKLPGRAVIRNASQVAVGDRLELKLHQGEIFVDVVKKSGKKSAPEDLFGG